MKTPTIEELLARDAEYEQKRQDMVIPGRRLLPSEFRREVAAYVLDVEQKAAGLSGEHNRQRLASVVGKWRSNLGLPDPTVQPPPRKTSFKLHIRLMFTDKADMERGSDVECMQNPRIPIEKRVDLASYEDVKKRAQDILDSLQATGRYMMPIRSSGGPWPPEWIALFKRWIEEGCPE